ncbi:hypothetical protein ACHAW5_003647 [Stephanodiscus triporus]|uniref:Uncharacterized protein n=1 Tax=Stephanodiscus triporus TaxID=2934178 RepID=A0ABD3NW59_9STRA
MSAERNIIGNSDSSRRSSTSLWSRSRSQHHLPQQYMCRSTAAAGCLGAPPQRRRDDSFRVSSITGGDGGPRSTNKVASSRQSRHDKGKAISLYRPRPIPIETLIDSDRQPPRNRSNLEMKESEPESKPSQDESSNNSKSPSPSRRESSEQITENHYFTTRRSSGNRGRSKSLQSNDDNTALRSTSTKKFVVEIGTNNEVLQVFEFSTNGILTSPDKIAVPYKARDESAASKRGETNACDDKDKARCETEKGDVSPYSSSPPPTKTRSRASSRDDSRDAIACSLRSSSSRDALSSSFRSSLRGSRCNLLQASVSFAMDSEGTLSKPTASIIDDERDVTAKNAGLDISARSEDSYYLRSIDISARSEDSRYRQSISSMSDRALETSERSSESNRRRSVRFFIDHLESHDVPSSSHNTTSTTGNVHERPIFLPPRGQSSTSTGTEAVSRDRSASPRRDRTLSRIVDFDPPASVIKSHQSPIIPPLPNNCTFLRREHSHEKAPVQRSMLTESTGETFSTISCLTADGTILTNHTTRAVVEEDATKFPTLIIESDSSGDDLSILTDPTYFMDKLVPTRVQGRATKDDKAMAQLSKKETKIRKIPPLKVSSSKIRTALKSKLDIPRETTETQRKGPSRVSVTPKKKGRV